MRGAARIDVTKARTTSARSGAHLQSRMDDEPGAPGRDGHCDGRGALKINARLVLRTAIALRVGPGPGVGRYVRACVVSVLGNRGGRS
jgi:hypothetical protein